MAVRGHQSMHVHTPRGSGMDPKERAQLVSDALREYEVRERAHKINVLVKERMTAKRTSEASHSDSAPPHPSVRLRERLALLKGKNPSPRKRHPSPPPPAPPPKRGSPVVRPRGRRISRAGGGHTMVAATELPAGLLTRGGGSPSHVSDGREPSAERSASPKGEITRRGRGWGRGRGRPLLGRGSLRQVSLEKAKESGDEDQKSPRNRGRGWTRGRARGRGRSRGRPPRKFRAARVTQISMLTKKEKPVSDADSESENSDGSSVESESGEGRKSLSTSDIAGEESKDEVVVEQEIISLNRDILENGDDCGDGRDSPDSDMVTVFPCVQVVQNSNESGAESDDPPASNVVLDALPGSSDSETSSLSSRLLSQPPTLPPLPPAISLPGRLPTVAPRLPSLAPRPPAPPPNAAGGRTILVGRSGGGPPTMVRLLPVPTGSAKGVAGPAVRPPLAVRPAVVRPGIVRPATVRPGMVVPAVVTPAVVRPSVTVRPARSVSGPAPVATGPRAIRTVVVSDISQPKSIVKEEPRADEKEPLVDKEEPLSEQSADAGGSDAERSGSGGEDSAAEMTPDTDMPPTELLLCCRELRRLKWRLEQEEDELRRQQFRLTRDETRDPQLEMDVTYPMPPSLPPLPAVSEFSATPGLVARNGAVTALRKLQRQHLGLYKWALTSQVAHRQSQTQAVSAQLQARRERRRLRSQLSGLLTTTQWRVLQSGTSPASWPEGDLRGAAGLRDACGDRGYQYLQTQCGLPLPALSSLPPAGLATPPTDPQLPPAPRSPQRPPHKVVTLSSQRPPSAPRSPQRPPHKVVTLSSQRPRKVVTLLSPQRSAQEAPLSPQRPLPKVVTVSSQRPPQKTASLAAQRPLEKTALGADSFRRISCRIRVKKEGEKSAGNDS